MVAVGACVLGVAGLAIIPGLLARRPIPSENLEYFDGLLAYEQHTYDNRRSELYVEASRRLKSGDAQAAEEIYRQIVAEYPRDARSFAALGACLVFQAKYESAKLEYQHALELDPQFVGALYGLGCAAYEQEQSAEAKDYLERALALAPSNALCHRVLGCVFDQIEDTSRALVHYERAVALDPSIAGDAVIRERVTALRELKNPHY